MAFTVEKNNELFPAVVAGDAAARDAMIEGNMALVVVKADSLIRQMPSVAYLRDESSPPATSAWSRRSTS